MGIDQGRDFILQSEIQHDPTQAYRVAEHTAQYTEHKRKTNFFKL